MKEAVEMFILNLSHKPGEILYVNKVDIGGWLTVRMKSGLAGSLPEFTKVQIVEVKNHKTWFKVLDGEMKGQTVALGEQNAKIFLGKNAPLQTGVMVKVVYEKIASFKSIVRKEERIHQMATLTVEGVTAQISLNTKPKPGEPEHIPLPPGLYKIKIPQNPHDKNMTSYYRERDQHDLIADQIWFPIEYGDNSRFIHLGHLSHGCVTVLELAKWNALYWTLIRHRVPGTNTIGQLIISAAEAE